MPFQFQRLEIPEIILVTGQRWGDGRGYFAETYKSSEFAANGIPSTFVQDNHSHSDQGVLRGRPCLVADYTPCRRAGREILG